MICDDLTIVLDGPIDEARGIKWPRDDRGWADVHAIEHPTRVSRRFPSGDEFRIDSKLSMLSQDQGIVSSVEISPLRDLVAFEEAVRFVESVGVDLGVDSQPQLKSKLSTWTNERPPVDMFETHSVRCTVEKGVSLFIEVKAHPTEKGWFVNLAFFATRFYDPPVSSGVCD